VDLERRLRRRHPDTHADTDANSHADPDAHSYSDADSHTDTHPDSRLCCLQSRHAIHGGPSSEQRRRLLSVHGGRLVLVERLVVLRAGHGLGMDLGLDPGDRIGLQRHADADADADADPNPDSDAHTDADAYSHPDAHPDSGSELRLQPVQGRDGFHQLEHRRDAKRRRRQHASDHIGHAFA